MSNVRIGLGAAALVLAMAGCSTESTARARADVIIDGNKRSITSGVRCTTSTGAAGNQTTHITAMNGVAQLDLSLSDATPPLVNGFGLALTSDPDLYRIPYQAPKKVEDAHANRDGKTYKVIGTGRGTKPGPKPAIKPGESELQNLKFQILVVCP
jgi:hypothetical protein